MEELKYIKEFFLINKSSNFGKNIFKILKKIVPFNEGYIFYFPHTVLKYSYNAKIKSPKDIQGKYLQGDLVYGNTKYGELFIKGKSFSKKNKELFEICTPIIADIIKDFEILDIVNFHSKSIQNINKKLRKSEEIKTNFISNVSHELRTPLNSILGYTELLGLAGTLNDKQVEYVNDIKIAGLKLLEMVNEILDMSKIEAGSIKLSTKKFEIEQAVTEVLNIIKPLIINKNLELQTKIENSTINADYQKFQQILLNLLSNAIKYAQNKILIKIKKFETSVEISVCDDGKGILKENFEKIFNKFEQLGDNKSFSTGLGLTITKEFVKLHNGTIKVKSSNLKGTEFCVKLPQ